MKAMIFAAGLGTRLKPLTDHMPKALVPVNGRPMLEHVILKLKQSGFNELVINIHHFGEQIIDFLEANQNFGLTIHISDEREQLLDTGGGIKKAAPFFQGNEPFLIHNVDILSDTDLKALYESHLHSGNDATLLASKRTTARYLLFDKQAYLRGWVNKDTGQTKPEGFEYDATKYQEYAFSGIHVISPSLFRYMDERWKGKFPIMDFYLQTVYMELIAHCIQSARQAIVLIPEIALTYQTVMRFFARFGNRVSIINSRLSNGERYDQFERAKNGDIDIMIGPRSALFTPFSNLGLIIIDEEHENSYKSESVPRYHAREVAIEYARMSDAIVVLGSATPSVDSYYKAKTGVYRLLELDKRVDDRPLPKCEVVDLRQELREGNRSILSTRLQELMEERLLNGQQTMLFLNRRGKSAFMSCRACGFVVKCPHCDVSLSEHSGGVMVCHYCGYRQPVPKVCPSCGSKYISGFKAGTQKIEAMVAKRFPQARILRMDYDTTRAKDAYEKILQAFSNHEADILIGTQMIVKGHDFSNVTLVGVLAADMSLHVNDFHAAERTFALLTQAAGRAGRGKLPGNVVIQTYDPDHYAIRTAKEQDYEAFYDKEIEYRRLMNYPPVWNMLLVHVTSPDESECGSMAQQVYDIASQMISHADENQSPDDRHLIQLIGPADATIAKVNDIYRKVIYMKTSDYAALISIKDGIEQAVKADTAMKHANISFDFNPMSGF